METEYFILEASACHQSDCSILFFLSIVHKTQQSILYQFEIC